MIKEEKKKINKEYGIFARNLTYSLLLKGSYLFAIIPQFLIVRLISKELWGFLLLAISTIIIVTIISDSFPPALDFSLNYYIPRYMVLKQKTKVKSLIKNAIYLKLLFLLPLFFISIAIFYLLSDLFAITLKDKINILYLLSPLIIIISFNSALKSIHKAFNKFRFLFTLLLIKTIFRTGALLVIFLFYDNVELELIAYIEIFSYLIPFLINLVSFLIIFFGIKNTGESRLSFREIRKNIFQYGFPIFLQNFAISIWKEIQIQGIGAFSTSGNISGFKISSTYSLISNNIVDALTHPLLISFTRLHSIQNDDEIVFIYELTVKYSLFFLLLVSGFLIFFGDFYIFIIYGESYLIFSIIFKLMIISTIFGVLIIPFNSFISAQKKTKYVPIIRLLSLMINVLFFFPALILFGFLEAIIAILISNILIFILYVISTFKLIKVNLNLKKMLFQYSAFFISLIATLILENIILKDFNFKVLYSLNLLFFEKLQFLSILTYLFIFLFLIILFKIFALKDIEYLELYFNKQKKFHKIIRKGLKIFKKLNILR